MTLVLRDTFSSLWRWWLRLLPSVKWLWWALMSFSVAIKMEPQHWWAILIAVWVEAWPAALFSVSLTRSYIEMLEVQKTWRCGVTGWWWGCCVISSWWDAPPRQGGCPVWSARNPRLPRPCAGRSAGTPTSCAAWGSLWRRSPPTVWSPCQSSPSCRIMKGSVMSSDRPTV